MAIIKQTGKFSLQAGGVEAKYFANSKTAALVFGEKIYGSGGYSIIKGTVSGANTLNKYWFSGIDAFKTFKGGAYVVPQDVLNLIKPIIR